MDELTNVVEDVVVETAEEVVTKIGLGTVLTGAFALTGVLTTVYGAVKLGQWAYGKVKAAKESKVEVLDAEEAAKVDARNVEAE